MWHTDQEFSDEENGNGRGEEVPDSVVIETPPPAHPEARGRKARAIARPVAMTKAQMTEHDFEGHANYHPGCEYCVRSRGLSHRHERH